MSFHNGILPREGFHADPLGRLIKHTLLNPALTLPLLVLARAHERGQLVAAEHPRLASALTVAAVWSTLRVVNGWLTRRSLNNGVNDEYDWEKEVVVVTGGADGIGKSIVLMLASRNIKVAVLDVQPLTYTAPPSVIYVSTDVTSPEALAAAHEKIRSHFNTDPTVLVLNAGVCRGKTILESTLQDNELTFKVNSIAHYILAREFLPPIVKANHGMVVTVASSAAWLTAPRMVDYAASKGAALIFHEGLSAELLTHYNAPRVRTVVVNQGYTKTKLFQGFGVKDGFFAPPLEVDTVAEAIVRQILSGRSGQVIEPGIYGLFLGGVRGWPNWMQHGFRAQLGDLMASWRGRQVDANAAKS